MRDQRVLCAYHYKGSRKKSSFLSGPATKRGGGGKGCATKEKITLFLYSHIF